MSTQPGNLQLVLSNLVTPASKTTLPKGSDVVGDQTDIQLEFTVQNEINQNGTLEMVMNKWNPGTQSRAAVKTMFTYSTADQLTGQSAFIIPCSSVGSPNLQCIFKPTAVQTNSDISTALDSLMITGFGNKINAGSTITIKTSDSRFTNPPSTAVVATFKANSYSDNGINKIDSQVSNITFKVETPYLLTSANVSIEASLGEINVQDKFTFTITLPLPMPVGSAIEMTIPPSINIFSDENRLNLILNSASGNQPLYQVPDVQVIDETLQKIRINNLVPQSKNYQDEGNPIVFTLLMMKNPGSTQQTESFKISIFDQENIILNVDNKSFFRATPGTLDQIEITPDNYKVRAKVNYRFSFFTRNSLFDGGQLGITLPPEILVDVNALKFTAVAGVNFGAITFEYDEATRNLKILNAFDSAQPAPSLVTFDLFGFQNGISTKPTAPFQLQTLDPSGKIIDQDNSQPLIFAANLISKIQTTACADQQTASFTTVICAYKLKFLIGSEYPIMSDSSLEIELPEDMELVDPTKTEADSFTDGIADLTSKFTVVDSSLTSFGNTGAEAKTIVVIKDAFAQASAPNGVDWRQDSFAITIAGILSPRSTAPTLSFKARIITPDGYASYKREQGVYSNVYQAKEFSIANIKRSSEINGDNKGYFTFTVQLSSTVYKNEYFKITPPSGVDILPVGEQCSSASPLQQQLSCTLSNGSLYILILPDDLTVESFAEGTFLTFTVRMISNPLTLRPTESFKLYVSTSISSDYYVNQIVSGQSILNVSPGKLVDVQLLADVNTFGAVTNYAIYFSSSNVIPANSQVEIEFPKDYFDQLNQVACVPLKGASASTVCSVSPKGPNILLFENAFDSDKASHTQIGFHLQGIKNPDTSIDQSVINSEFFITTIAPDGFAIDQSSNPDFSLGCTYPCQSCDSVQTKCTSCAMSLADSTFQLKLDTASNTCLLQCLPGQYDDANAVCQQCAYPCERCEAGANFCDSCLQASGSPFLDVTEGKCYSTCPDGTFLQATSSTCEKCVDTCSTCISQSECTSCVAGSYFYEGACLSECPETSIPFDDANVNECLACQNNCYSCEGEVTICTACLPTFFFSEGQCLDSCPRNYQPDENNLCYRASEFTLPFVTFAVTAGIIVVVSISNKITYDTRPFSSFLALESAWLIFFWFYYAAFLIKDGHSASTMLVAFALVSNYIINLFFYDFYKERILKEDTKYIEYKKANKGPAAQIIQWSMLTSFQLFRLTYCGMFKKPEYNCKMGIRQKYFKRMNRYTLFEVTFVFVPVFTASIYNLFYTWPGRQVYWIDLENIVVTGAIFICHLIVLVKTEKEYLLEIFNLDDDELQFGNRQGKKNQRRKIPVDSEVRRLAYEVAENGIDVQKQNEMKELTKFQRVGLLQAIYEKLWKRKESKVANENFRMKHGRGQQFNDQHMPNQQNDDLDVVGIAEFTEVSDPQPENIPNKMTGNEHGKMIKMFYSSNREEEEKEAQQNNDRKYQYSQFEQDKTNTEMDLLGPEESKVFGKGRGDDGYEEVRNDTTGVDVTLTGVMGDPDEVKSVRMSTVCNDDNAFGQVLKLKSDLRKDSLDLRKDSDKRRDSERRSMGDTGSQFNQVMQSARNPVDAEALNKDEEDSVLEIEMKNFQSAPINGKSALRGNDPLKQRLRNLQAELARKGLGRDEYDDKNLSKMLKMEEDSDDALDNFKSEVWGDGTSKIVANHYEGLHARNQEKARNDGKNEDLHVKHFLEIGNQLENARKQKQSAKDEGLRNAERRTALEEVNRKDRIEIDKLIAMLKQLQDQINAELARLRAAEERKKRDIDFVENAFYTSNEEGMGVSPGNFDLRNQMPKRPGTRSRSPKKEIPFNDPILQPFADQVANQKNLPKKKLKSATRSPRRRKSPKKQKKQMSKSTTFMQRGPSYGQGGTFGTAMRIIPDIRKENSGLSPKIRERTLSSTMSQMRRKRDNSGYSASSYGKAKGKKSRKGLNIPRVREEDEFEYYTSEDENGEVVKKLRRKKSPRKSRSPRKAGKSPNRSKSPVRGRNKGVKATVFEPAQTETNKFNYTPTNPTIGQRNKSLTNHHSRYQAPIEESPRQRTDALDRRIRADNGSALRASAQMMITSETTKRKTKSKARAKDYSGVYFKHTNFERAVIATNGRAPYNNKEVEVITKPEGFDPSKFEFKNDWVNSLINSNSKQQMAAAGIHASSGRARAGDNNQSSFGRESEVAGTLYKGQIPSENTHPIKAYPEGIPRGDYNQQRPLSGLTHEQMLHESPVSMLNKQSDAKMTKPPLRPKGAAPDMIMTTDGSQNQQHQQRDSNGQLVYDMPSQNYFNHLDGNEK